MKIILELIATIWQKILGSKTAIQLLETEWSRVYNNHEPIISKEVFEKAKGIKRSFASR